MRLLMVLILAVTLLAGCGGLRGQKSVTAEVKVEYRYSKTPEQAIQGFLAQVNAVEYGQAAAYYHGAIERWRIDPSMWKTTVELVTHQKRIVRFEPFTDNPGRTGDAATISGWGFYDDDSQRQVTFEFAKKPQGWIIVSWR